MLSVDDLYYTLCRLEECNTCQPFSNAFRLLQKSCNLFIHFPAICGNYHTTL